MTFNEAYNEVLANEGGYVNDPLDSGGETYKGIARKHWPNWEGWPVIDQFKAGSDFKKSMAQSQPLQAAVRQFYKEYFWDVLRCDEMPHEIRLELFDTAVNQSKFYAGTFLQRALNLLNRGGADYADLKVDGKVGQMTIDAAKSCKNKDALMVTLNVLQGQRYVKLTERNPKNERFFNGWILRRVSMKH